MIKFSQIWTISILLFSHWALAGLPPTTSKVSGDSAGVVTFNYQFPNFTATHTGSTTVFGVNAIAGGGTNNGSLAVTAGGLIYTDGSKMANTGAGSAGYVMTYPASGTVPSWAAPTGGTQYAPTIQKFTSGSGTYTLPSSPKTPLYIRVQMVAAGGSGGSNSTAGSGGTDGLTGGNSTFGTSLLVTNGGVGGSANTQLGGAGGTASLGSGPIGNAVSGGSGGSATFSINTAGGSGGSSPLGGGGGGGSGSNGLNGATNTGGGGGGGGGNGSHNAGGAGGAGGYVDAIISSPSSTYSYAVGAAATGGSGNTSGGNSGSGVIVVTEYYQ